MKEEMSQPGRLYKGQRAKDGTHQAYVLFSLQERVAWPPPMGVSSLPYNAGSSPPARAAGQQRREPLSSVFASALPSRGSAVRKLEGMFFPLK